MKKYEFTLFFTEPEVWVYKVVIYAYNLNDAYYEAFYDFAQHISQWHKAPSKLEISYIEKGGD